MNQQAKDPGLHRECFGLSLFLTGEIGLPILIYVNASLVILLVNILLSLMLCIAILSLKFRGKPWFLLLIFIYISIGLHRLGLFIENPLLLIYLPAIFFPAFLSMGPVIQIYTGMALQGEKPEKWKYYFILPLALGLVHLFLVFLGRNSFMTVDRIMERRGFQLFYSTAMGFLIVLYNFVFLLHSVVSYNQYYSRFKQNYSDDRIKHVRSMAIFIALTFLYFLKKTIFIIRDFYLKEGISHSIIEDIFVLLFLLFMTYILMAQRMVFPAIAQVEKDGTKTKYARNTLKDRDRREYARLLEDYMKEEKPFLDEEISISQVADSLGIPKHYLSMTINTEFNVNFFHYINQQRIEYAKKLLDNPTSQELNILQVAFESGFQSKTTFNRYFKNIIGRTPSDYRRNRGNA